MAIQAQAQNIESTSDMIVTGEKKGTKQTLLFTNDTGAPAMGSAILKMGTILGAVAFHDGTLTAVLQSRPGSITGVSVFFNASGSSTVDTFNVLVNGSSVWAINIPSHAAGPVICVETQPRYTDSFVAEDGIYVTFTSFGSSAASNIICLVEVMYDD